MAITDTAHNSAIITRFFGLSTDTKPSNVMVGADFYETDTGIVFRFDGSSWFTLTRTAAPESPARSVIGPTTIAGGSNADLDSSTIPASTTGKLMGVYLSSTAAGKWEVKSRDAAVEISFGIIFTSGLLAKPTELWQPPHRNFATLVGAGVDENFRVTVTNLGNQSADFYASFYWDEV